MSSGSFSLLRLLGAGAMGFDTPAGGGLPDPRVRDAAAPSDFGAMLESASRGELRSDLPVKVPPALDGQIDRSLLDQISTATDLAASEGIRRALVIAGGRTFRVDVGARSVIDAPGAQQAAVGNIDGVVRAAPTAGIPPGRTDAVPADGPARVVRNTSLLRVLADRPANPE
jgi:hypothetical protein